MNRRYGAIVWVLVALLALLTLGRLSVQAPDEPSAEEMEEPAPELATAPAGPGEVPPESQDRPDDEFATVRALIEDKDDFGAADRLRALVRANPQVDVPEELGYLLDEFGGSRNLFRGGQYVAAAQRFWQEVRHGTIGSSIAVTITIVIGVLCVIVVAAASKRLVSLTGAAWGALFGPPKLDVGDFQGALESVDAHGVAALVEEGITKLATEVDRPLAHLVSAPIQPASVPEAVQSTVPSPLNILFDLMDWLLTQPVITLTGCLQHTGDRGLGLTLALVDKRTGRVLDQWTMWQQDYGLDCGPESDLEKPTGVGLDQLAKPAAVWTAYKYNEHIRASTEPFELLGTEDWRSYAFFLAGVDWRLEGELAKARRLFVEALNRDPNNRGALLNLGTLYMEVGAEGHTGHYRRAIERLKRAQDASMGSSKLVIDGKVICADLVWYKATYQLAATYFYMYADSQRPAEGNARAAMLERAMKDPSQLVVKALDQIKCLVVEVLDQAQADVEESARSQKPTEAIDVARTWAVETLGGAGELVRGLDWTKQLFRELGVVKRRVDQAFDEAQGRVRDGHQVEMFNGVIVEIRPLVVRAFGQAQQRARASRQAREPVGATDLARKLIEDGIARTRNLLQASSHAGRLYEALRDDKIDVIVKHIRQESLRSQTRRSLELLQDLAVIMYASILKEQKLLPPDIESEAEKIIARGSRLSYRVHYNVASYRSIAGKLHEEAGKEKDARDAYQLAIAHVHYAFERGGDIVRWALYDPSLRGVRDSEIPVAKDSQERFKDRFRKLRQTYSDEPKAEEPPPLASFLAIGPVYAQKMKEYDGGIVSIDDLAAWKDVTSLANYLHVGVGFVNRWIELAKMTGSIIGIDVPYANLLEAAGIASIGILAKQKGHEAELYKWLEVVNNARAIVEPHQFPSDTSVAWWVAQAQKFIR
jgi:tetratricopeptide (TPR) repeat protein